MRKTVLLSAALALVAATAFAVIQFAGGPEAKAGECLTGNPDLAATGCTAENARFKVGKVLADASASCPGGDDEYIQVARSGGKLCLLPNLVEGACYQPADNDDSWGRSACSGEETVKVAKVIQAAGGDTECPDAVDDLISIVYPEPPITYCLAPVQKAPA